MKKTIHILNGDALKEQFPKNLNGELIIARECLVDGNVSGDDLDAFWRTRAGFLLNYSENNRDHYYNKVVTEFQKIIHLENNSIVNLWFEEDLFCQVNLWFCCHLLNNKDIENIFLIRPLNSDWKGFGGLDSLELIASYDYRKKLNQKSISHLANCWNAFKVNDLKALKKLSFLDLDNFPFLPQVVQAHIDRFPGKDKKGKPERIISQIMNELNTAEFGKIFQEFSKRAGIYGFGDLQVKRIFDNMNGERLIINY